MSRVGLAMSEVDMAKRQDRSEGSAQTLKPAVLVPSWDITTPPVLVGLTRADTVKSALVASAGPVVARAAVVPLRATSGLNVSPVFHAAAPVPDSGRLATVTLSAAVVAAAPAVTPWSDRFHAWLGVRRGWGCPAVIVAVPPARPVTVHAVAVPPASTVHR